MTAIAIYGSVAKGEDGPYSDLEMWVATRQEERTQPFYVYKGLTISITYRTEEAMLKEAGPVTSFWPIEADEFRSYLVLFERGDFIQSLKQATTDLRDEDFLRSIRVRMARTYESVNKVRNAWKRKDNYDVLAEGRVLAWSVAMTLGVINRRYYRSGRGFYQASKSMGKQPGDYSKLLDLAGGFTTVDTETVYQAGMELWANLVELVGEIGVEWDFSELAV